MMCEAMIVVDAHGAKVGACVYAERDRGWRFLPATTSRKLSRKAWPTATAALPKWAFDVSEEMLTASEFEARKVKQ